MRQTTTMDRPKGPSSARPGEQGRREDDDREAIGIGDDDLTDDELDELDDEDIEDESEDDEA